MLKKFSFGHPFAGGLFAAMACEEVPARVEVPLVLKRSRGLGDARSSGTKVEVMMCVPVVLTFQEAFQASRVVILPLTMC